GQAEAAEQAAKQFRGLRQLPALTGWAVLGQAFLSNRDHQFARAEELLRQASLYGDSGDHILQASINHQRGFWLYHAGNLNEALAALHKALDLCGRDHFLTGHVLGTLGQVYANKNSFHAAQEFLERSIRCKERFGDERAVAAGWRMLGQLYFDWGYPERAEQSFKQAL